MALSLDRSTKHNNNKIPNIKEGLTHKDQDLRYKWQGTKTTKDKTKDFSFAMSQAHMQ